MRARSRGLFTAVAVVGLIGFGIVSWNLSNTDHRDAARAEPSARAAAVDAGDGDELSPAAQAERYLPIPAALEDERVIAALAPIADVSCKRSDYEASAAAMAHEARLPDLGPTEGDAGMYSWIDRYATDAALAPIADHRASAGTSDSRGADSLREPVSSSEPEIDALLTRNLFGAALAPIAALPAPERRAAITRVAVTPQSPAADCPALLQYTFNRLQTGEQQSLCQFRGKVLVIVNTASYCGYTKQYEGLEAMYKRYKDRGLVVVGFPSNDFGNQEPGSNSEIAEFCRTTYGVQFPMFEKSSVARLDANPLYVELAKRAGAAPRWNFHKYVVDRNGARVASFASDVTPDARSLVDLIERLLAEPAGAVTG